MDFLHINSMSDKKQCCILVSDTDFIIEGDFYYLINKDIIFHRFFLIFPVSHALNRGE